MKKLLVALLATMGLAVYAESGFVQIFNGRDLDGWIGAKHLYYVENGELVFKEGPKNFGNLFYHKPFANFTARFSFKLVPNGTARRCGRRNAPSVRTCCRWM